MGLLNFLRRSGSPPASQCTLAGDTIASSTRAWVDTAVRELIELFPSLDERELRLRVWVVETSVFPLAAHASGISGECADDFFRGFWPRVMTELVEAFPNRDSLRQDFHAAVEQLVSGFEGDEQDLEPQEAVRMAGKRIAEFLEIPGSALASVWGRFAIEFGHKQAAASQLMATVSNHGQSSRGRP